MNQNNSSGNNPDEFKELSEEEQATLTKWIADNIVSHVSPSFLLTLNYVNFFPSKPFQIIIFSSSFGLSDIKTGYPPSARLFAKKIVNLLFC